jgi:dihydroflavonol-4-reductase
MTALTLVTGGAGFIGSHLVRLLLDRGETVRVLERPGAPVEHLPLDRIELVRGDIRDRRAVADAVRGCEVVYHLAANPRLWTQRRGEFRQVNYEGAVNVLEAALAAGARRVLHTSTESILTRAQQTGPIREDQAVTLRDVIGPYCRSKYLAERHALALARRGAPVVVVNPTIPVGPGDLGRSPPTQMMLDFCRGGRREYLDAGLNLIDVRDVAEGIARAMERGRPGRRYLLGHENWSVRAVFAELARLTGLPEPTRRVPYALALAAAHLSELWADVVSHRPPAATVTGVKLTRRAMHFDARRSLDELGLAPRPVRAALAGAVAWFREVGWLRADRHRDLRAAYHRTSYEVEAPGGRLRLRVGEPCPALDALLDRHGVRDWAYVTAHNPGSVPRAHPVNEREHDRLAAEVRDLGHAAYPGEGVGDDGSWLAERSLLVLGITREEARALGRRYEQAAVVVGRRGGAPELLFC